jgi:hypothetical protein
MKLNSLHINAFRGATKPLTLNFSFYDKTYSYLLIFWTGLIFAISHTLKSGSKYQGYRFTESDYYDSIRELLDTPERDDKKLEDLVNAHIEIVEKI